MRVNNKTFSLKALQKECYVVLTSVYQQSKMTYKYVFLQIHTSFIIGLGLAVTDTLIISCHVSWNLCVLCVCVHTFLPHHQLPGTAAVPSSRLHRTYLTSLSAPLPPPLLDI